MNAVEKVEFGGEVFALILRHQLDLEGVNFLTPRENPIQLGILQHRQGAEILAHFHKDFVRRVDSVQEVLHIEYGKVEASFYTKDGTKVGMHILDVGDTILLMRGGHGFKVLEDAIILEVKQGPYYGTSEDKECLHLK